MEQTTLEIIKKDSFERTLIFEDSKGNRLDITDWKVYFMAKTNINDVDGSAVITKTITSHSNATNGETILSLSSSDTNIAVGNYYYSIKVITDETVGVAAEALTILNGMLDIQDCVIQAVS